MSNSQKILLISELRDVTTDKVTKWLVSQRASFKRKNFEEISSFSIQMNTANTNVNLGYSDIKFIWNRRARLQLLSDTLTASEFNVYLKKEELPIHGFIENHYKNINKWSGSFIEEKFNNKLINLSIAQEVGLNIPETLVTNNKAELMRFLSNWDKVMVKCIYNDPNIIMDNRRWYCGTNNLINDKHISNLAKIFAPSIFQAYIDKQYEVRVFIFQDKMYPMAILSQGDEKTQLDYRNYNTKRPNRNLPYKLPGEIADKIRNFMSIKNMDSGSIDLMVDANDNFIFLEINPQGQLDWVSANCNYYIEKDIAIKMINA